MRRHGAGGFAGSVKEESGSFLKKKNQKTFLYLRATFFGGKKVSSYTNPSLHRTVKNGLKRAGMCFFLARRHRPARRSIPTLVQSDRAIGPRP
jgi:hypothetical protein